jgi:hypothetical protein
MNLGKDPTFPKRSTCKNCFSKPCQWFLRTYNEPGSFMFFKPSDFTSIPCYTPSVAEEAAKSEPEAETDTMQVVQGTVTITNPRWEHKDESKKSDSPDKATIGDTITLQADISNYPEGASVTFDIFDSSGASPFRIKTVNGKNVSGVGKGEWVIEDPNDQGEKLKISFEAIAKSKATEKCKVEIELREYVPSF